MNYLSVEQLTKTYADRTIFEDLSFGIDQGQKVALVAKNGSGKSTLIRCIMGEEPFDSGRVVFRNGINIAYLQQADDLNPENTIYEEIFDHDLPKLNVFKKYSKAVRENDELAMAELFEEISELNAWDLDSLVEQVLSKLKLDNHEAKISTLSGGQRKRVALAKVLISEPDFLFLDEPTNHLDLDMIEWLEEYLSKSNSTLFMVTHDRYFLEVITDIIYELEDEQIYRYKGNFSYYLEKKAEREENKAIEVGKARSLFKSELQWIRRQPKARGTKQKARTDAFEGIKKTASQNIEKEELEIPIKMERLGSKILELHKVSKSYPNLNILDNLTYTFKRQERLGIVGPNGVGKSTLLRIIMGEEAPDSGKVVVGDTVVFGYYSQANIEVDENMKVIDVIRDVAEFIPLEKGREMSAAHFLEKFLFPRHMHHNYVYKLSGGEQRRLKLMKVLMSNPNFLILDEPTNDLDIYILSVLEDYLKNFQGCLIVVSHDRYFMDKMVDHIFVFEGDANIKDITGNYTVYRQNLKKEILEEQAEKRLEKAEAAKVPVEKKVEKSVQTEAKRKLSFKEKNEFETLDSEIEKLETEKEELTAILSGGTSTSEELNEASKRIGELMIELEAKTERWMELAEFA
ncbi:ABC-F family ATP-binding cassette domain-containing protein [Brumimicrobium oceani]|uniref:ABC transporter n=1 Tax=Brumimicrobium oceani TaxID=2100725 RepID=A0A2U2XFK1_9FLAO|nr:ABC-F family ATP-binding cassette domain-containing protein [Brumimicrobium oceani]PWH86578.1 ABC transporter [Brumimicrobium oceani]